MVLLGLLLALALAALTLYSVSQIEDRALEVENLQWQQAAREGLQILDATRNAYAEASPMLANRWPVDPIGSDTRLDTLADGGFLLANAQDSVYGTAWQLTVAGDALSASLRLVTPNTTTARVLAAQLPQGVAAGTTATATITRPGDEAIHSLLYARDGSRALTGDADANDNAITNTGRVLYEP